MHKKQNKPKAVSFWMRPELGKEIEEKGDNRTLVINRALEPLYTHNRLALRDVKIPKPQARFLVIMQNGSMMDAYTAGTLWASAEDACALDGLDKKWKIDGKAFVEKLKKLSDTQALALVDAAERFWQANTGSMGEEDIKRFFRMAVI